MNEYNIIKTIKMACKDYIDSEKGVNNFALEGCRQGEISWGDV